MAGRGDGGLRLSGRDQKTPEDSEMAANSAESPLSFATSGRQSFPDSGGDPLNRALVAGLILEVLLENPGLGELTGSQRQQLKTWVKSTLAARLAGRLPLASFNRLAQGADFWFEILYPLLSNATLSPRAITPPSFSRKGRLPEELVRRSLARISGLLPTRRHRKLNQEKLCAFLAGTGGGWFRLRDFEAYFGVDRKTAWEYVHKLLKAGLLEHNRQQSTAVRYRLAPAFLTTPESPQG